jgi:hypothetical protein
VQQAALRKESTRSDHERDGVAIIDQISGARRVNTGT